MKEIIANIAKSSIGTIFDGASKIITNFKADPTEVVKAQESLAELKVNAETKMQELSNQLEETYAKEMESVNQTMRDESKSEHWMQWSWRPFIAFTFAAILINNYIVLPYFKSYGAQPITVPDCVYTAILVILGAASAGRGLSQWQSVKNNQ